MSQPSSELADRRYRTSIPRKHRTSLDTRVLWLWNQRFGTVQTIYTRGTDELDVLACTIFIQAIIGKDLASIGLIFKRVEGGPQTDEELLEQDLSVKL